MSYSMALSREAESDIDVLSRADSLVFKRILNKTGALADHPWEGKPLVGDHKGEYFLRVGSYCIVYELDTEKQIVFILTIKHRKHVY